MKEITNTTKDKAMVTGADIASWGQGPIVTANDIIIPKIWPMQFVSEKVKSGEAKYGEFRDSVNFDKFGDLETPFEVIPFHMELTWMEFEVTTNKAGARKKEFKQTIPVQNNPNLPGYNDDLPYAEDKIERDRIMNFYVLIPSEVAAGTALPYVISFKRTSIKAGKKLVLQMFVRNRDAGLAPCAVTFNLSGKTVQNDDGEYVVMDVATSRKSTEAEVATAFKWYQQIQKGMTKIDETEIA